MSDAQDRRRRRMVRISNRTGVGRGTKVVFGDTGEDLRGIVTIAVQPFGADNLVRAELHLHVAEIDVEAEPRFLIRDPLTGAFRQIARIQFTEGEDFVATDPEWPIQP